MNQVAKSRRHYEKHRDEIIALRKVYCLTPAGKQAAIRGCQKAIRKFPAKYLVEYVGAGFEPARHHLRHWHLKFAAILKSRHTTMIITNRLKYVGFVNYIIESWREDG